MFGGLQARVADHLWKIYFPNHPRTVSIVAEQFMEKDAERVSHWFDLGPGQTIDGLLLETGIERRVYVVTTTSPEGYAWAQTGGRYCIQIYAIQPNSGVIQFS